MKHGNSLYNDSNKRSHSRWKKPQGPYQGLSESQIKELINTEQYDEVPTGSQKSMNGKKVYGYDSYCWDRGFPNWNYINRWLRKRVGFSRKRVEEEFIQLWSERGMNTYMVGPLEYIKHHHIDAEQSASRYARGFYWDENNILRMYSPQRWGVTKFPEYSTIEKRKANKEVFNQNWDKIRGAGPIGIGSYFIDADKGKELHHCVAIRTDLWNQGLPKDQQYEASTTWKVYPTASQGFLDYLHSNYKPVNILGVGVKTARSEKIPLGYENVYRYVFATPE